MQIGFYHISEYISNVAAILGAEIIVYIQFVIQG